MADYALVLVNAGQPPTHMTVHHLKLCRNMGIPVIILLTKSDRTPQHVFQSTKQEISRILKSHPDLGQQRPFVVKSKKDVDTIQHKLTNSTELVPIISVSCVTGEGMDVLQKLLANLPQRRRQATKQRSKPFECLIEEIYQVQGVGTVISGVVTRGEWKKGEALYIGPLKDGTIFKVVPKSTHVAQTFVDRVWAGHTMYRVLCNSHTQRTANIFWQGHGGQEGTIPVIRRVRSRYLLNEGPYRDDSKESIYPYASYFAQQTSWQSS